MADPLVSTPTNLPSSSTPRPGDGAYLAASQPGDGRFLTRSNNQARGGRGGPSHRGRGRGAPGSSQNGRSSHRDHSGEGESTQGHASLVSPMSNVNLSNGMQGNGEVQSRNQEHAGVNGTGGARNGDSHNHPHRPRQPREIIQTPSRPLPDSSASVDPSQNGMATNNSRDKVKGNNRGRKKQFKGDTPNGQGSVDVLLDPSAPSFTPSASTPITSATSSRPNSPSRPSKQGGQKKSRASKPKPAALSTETNAAPKSSRRAAFEQQTKLSTPMSKSLSNGSGGQADTALNGETDKPKRAKKPREPEKDDLVSRLTRGLRSRPFLECPICFNSINPAQPIWSCLPPTSPPEIPKNLDNPPVPPSNHYSACYTPFHLSCIRDWASRSLVEERERARNAGRDEDDISWRCPGCQKRRQESVGGYRCFCGRLSSPSTLPAAPHSCGDHCGRKKPGCAHACPMQCHPGPCPPCQTALIVPCPSHNTPLTVKCSVASSNNAALTPVCDEVCGRERGCGNLEHACLELCHYGECAPCSAVEIVRCYCGEESKEVSCGWNGRDEKKCVKLGANGEQESWDGRFCCGRSCDAMYDCGIHPCEQSCHPHPLRALPCPSSPSQVTHCPCGQTLLSSLSAPLRKDCLSPVPTCGQACPKSRPCGHQCPRKCHEGDCPPCHEEVVRTCRCGESMLVIGCDELRAKAQKGEDVLCERPCKALRNCGRHECGRICCPLSYMAKNRKAKRDDASRLDVDDLHECHLTCGKLLSCGLHTCQKKDHKGACGKCLQASYEELICHCGHTVIYPPVACGTTLNCLYPCARDSPECGHPKTAHPCHESPQCPPCPFLTSKPCACGKDSSVKNVRCSQEKVSCGQPCGSLLSCGYHRCGLTCHRPGECEPCHQTCSKPKKICRHPCTIPCHAPTKCPENDPCQAIITQTCACGHVQQRTSCGASNANPQSREQTTLRCNSECAVRQRNARLADALGISAANKDGSGQNQEQWNTEMKGFTSANLAFVKMVEGTFADFIKGVRQTLVLPYMPPAKRTFVMSLAETYRLARELVDQEPNRSVMIRRRLDTRIPTPLLSSVVNIPPPKPSFGALGNLRAKSPWVGGASTPTATSGGGTIASLLTSNPKPSTSTNGTTANAGVGSISRPSSKPPTRTTTPIPAVAPTPIAPLARGENVLGEGKKIGDGAEVNEDDWDVSGDEA